MHMWAAGILFIPYVVIFIIMPGCFGCCQSLNPDKNTYRGGKFLREMDIMHSAIKGEVMSQKTLSEKVDDFVHSKAPRVFLRINATKTGYKRRMVTHYIAYLPLEVELVIDTTPNFGDSIQTISRSTYRPIVVLQPTYTFTNPEVLDEMKKAVLDHFGFAERYITCEVTVEVEDPGTDLIATQLKTGRIIPEHSMNSPLCKEREQLDPFTMVLQIDNEEQPHGCRSCCEGWFYNSFFLWFPT